MFEIFKKVEFNSQITSFIKELESIEWFSKLGQGIELTIQLENVQLGAEALKVLKYDRNVKGIVCLDNLINEASNRASAYLSKNRKRDFEGKWNRLAKKINREIDFSEMQIASDQFNNSHDTNINLFLNQIVRGCIVDLYFSELDSNYPLFFSEIFEVYKKGKTVVGWEGKFSFKNELRIDKISNQEGKLLIW